jgi:hypothetical protein
MEKPQAESLGMVLSRAFYNDPRVGYILPDETARRAVLPWYFRSVAIRTSQLWGEVYTTAEVDGGALWISPKYASTFARMLKTKLFAMPFKLDGSSFTRWINLTSHLQWVHRRLVEGPHWYLMALGIEPSKSPEIAGTLIEPVLYRADFDHVTCYTEAFSEDDLPLYEKYGFRIAGVGRIPGGGPSFWSLTRVPA